MMSTPSRLTDTHCHLNLADFEMDLAEVIEHARQAGVGPILIPGIDVPTSRRAVQIAEETPGLYAAVGMHPHHADQWGTPAREQLRDLARSPRVVALGEIGLDFYRNLSPQAAQREAFREQLELADELKLPVVVHSREAVAQVLDDLDAWEAPSLLAGRRGVMHAFAGSHGDASRAVDGGLYLGVAGPITYPRSQGLRQLLTAVPRERLLIETDAPYLPPVPHRGERNEPAYVALIARALADVVGESPEDLARDCAANASALLGWTHDHANHDLL